MVIKLLKIGVVVGIIDVGKVLEKANMKFEGVLRSRVVDKNGKRSGLVSYSIIKEEYLDNLMR